MGSDRAADIWNRAVEYIEDDAKAREKLEVNADDAYGLEDGDIDQSFQRALASHAEAFQR